MSCSGESSSPGLEGMSLGGQEWLIEKALELTRLIEISQIKQGQTEKRAYAKAKGSVFWVPSCDWTWLHLGGAWRADGDCIGSGKRWDTGNKLKKRKRKSLATHGKNFGLYSTRWKASEVVGFFPHSRDWIGEARCWRKGGQWRPCCNISDNKYSLLGAAARWG